MIELGGFSSILVTSRLQGANSSCRLSESNPVDTKGISSPAANIMTLWMLSITLCLLAHQNMALCQLACDAGIYGKPFSNDCFVLYDQLPGEKLSPGIDKNEPRSFVEPKFLDPPFAPVPNPFNSQMVQLPKIWRYGMSR